MMQDLELAVAQDERCVALPGGTSLRSVPVRRAGARSRPPSSRDAASRARTRVAIRPHVMAGSVAVVNCARSGARRPDPLLLAQLFVVASVRSLRRTRVRRSRLPHYALICIQNRRPGRIRVVAPGSGARRRVPPTQITGSLDPDSTRLASRHSAFSRPLVGRGRCTAGGRASPRPPGQNSPARRFSSPTP